MILFNVLEFEDSYEDLNPYLKSSEILSGYHDCQASLILFIFVLFIYLSQSTTLTSIHYMAVSVDLFRFQIYLIFYSSSVVFSV